MIKVIVYKIVSFILNNWKHTLKIIIAVYFITAGVTLLAGSGAASIAGLPSLNLNIPTL